MFRLEPRPVPLPLIPPLEPAKLEEKKESGIEPLRLNLPLIPPEGLRLGLGRSRREDEVNALGLTRRQFSDMVSIPIDSPDFDELWDPERLYAPS